jgi:hypothetical protein
MSLTTGEMSAADIAAVVGNKNNDGFGWGGDGGLITILLILALFGGGFGGFGGGFGGGYGFGNMYEFPWLLTGQQGINNNTNAGFRDSMLQDSITSVRDGIAGLSTQLCGCCSDMQMALANGFAGVEQGANARQIANMQSDFALQNAINQGFNGTQASLANCCCENRLGIADLKYTVATENCADRAALSDGIRDVIASNTASTQRILDQLCQDKIDAKNDTIAQLRQELLFARGQASQDVQTAEIRANNATVANQLLNEMRSCPIPAQPVYGSTPIFTCNSNTGCGCGSM